MKKLNLTPSTLQKGDVLSRSQLKKVLGGDYGPNTGGPIYNCTMTVTHKPGGGADYSNMPPNGQPTNPEQAQVWCLHYTSNHPGTGCTYSCVM